MRLIEKQRVLRNDGPACRCCNCTEHNACGVGCSWVKVPRGERRLCSACAGTASDVIETGRRIVHLTNTTNARLDIAVVTRALMRRVRVRERAKEEE
jgi:hypothetical protein